VSEERSAGVWVGRSVPFDCKHYKSLFFEISNVHKANSFIYLGRYSRMSGLASMLACVILFCACLWVLLLVELTWGFKLSLLTLWFFREGYGAGNKIFTKNGEPELLFWDP
jgi:hypothetical protein